MINSRGLSNELWWTPMWTLITSLYKLFILTRLLAFWYIWTTHTILSDMLTFLKSTIGPFWATCRRSGSANAKLRLRFFPMYFSWISVKMKMASVVPRPGVKPNHMSSTFTTLGVLIFAGIYFRESQKNCISRVLISTNWRNFEFSAVLIFANWSYFEFSQ